MVDEGVDDMYQHWKLVNHFIGGNIVGNLIVGSGLASDSQINISFMYMYQEFTI